MENVMFINTVSTTLEPSKKIQLQSASYLNVVESTVTGITF